VLLSTYLTFVLNSLSASNSRLYHATTTAIVNALQFEASFWLPEKKAKEPNNLFANEEEVTSRMVFESPWKIIQGKKDRMTKDNFTIISSYSYRLPTDSVVH